MQLIVLIAKKEVENLVLKVGYSMRVGTSQKFGVHWINLFYVV